MTWQQEDIAPFDDRVMAAIRFMEENASGKVLLDDIAAAANLSPFHFHRVFKAFTQTSAHQYLTRIRLERAAHLLLYGETEIADLAFVSGYENPESFSRAFRAYFGVSPSGYRAKGRSAILLPVSESEISSLDQLGVQYEGVRTIDPVQVAFIRHEGSYDQVGKTWGRLSGWAFARFQFGRHTSTLGIVHDNPVITGESFTRYDACLVVRGNVRSSGPVQLKTLSGGAYAVYRFKGPYDVFFEVYDAVYAHCLLQLKKDLRNEPALEWYIQSPPFYQPPHYLTDFYVPVTG